MAIIQNKRSNAVANITAAALKAGELAFVVGVGADQGLGFIGIDGQAGTAVKLRAGSAESADTATKLTTARNISLTGVVTAPAVAFDGSGAVALATTIANGTLTKDMLAADVQTTLGKADSALQESDIVATGAGGANGTITVKGNEISVKGLGDAAFKNVGTAAGDIPVLDQQGHLPVGSVPDISANYAKLDAQGKIDDANLPTYVGGVTATADKGIEVAGTAKNPTIGVKIDTKADNALTVGADGLYVAKGTAPEYTIVKATTASAGNVATYKLQKDGTDVAGSVINIPLDYLVKSATLKTVPQGGDDSGLDEGHKYIDFEVNVKEGTGTASHLYLDVADLVDVYTSGSAADAPIVIAVSNDNKITATLTDGKIGLAKLSTDIQTSLGKADTAVQPADVTTGATNGTIKIGQTEIAVAGLGDAAYKNTGTGAGNIPVLDAQGHLPTDAVPDLSTDYLKADTKGAANGLAPLGADSKVPDANLPDYVGTLTAADKSVTVAGTGKAKTVAVAISTTADNALTLDANGLFVAKGGITAGNGIDVSAAQAVSVKIDTANANGLSVGADGVAMGIASATKAGAVKASTEIAVAADGTMTVEVVDCGVL